MHPHASAQRECLTSRRTSSSSSCEPHTHAARQPPRAGAQMRACGAGYTRGDVLTAAAAAVQPRSSCKRTGVKSFLMLNVLRISSGVLPARADRRRCA
jgi:hypothetical protein